MRIIGGQFKGRRFVPPAKNWPTRPTTDFAKEALFNMLNNRLDFSEMTMLDLFGGTGSHSYECISRGCDDATYVDKFDGCVRFVKKTASELNIEDKIKIFKADVFNFLQTNQRQYDYIFAGPPYPLPNLQEIPDKVFLTNTLAEDGLFVLEHDNTHTFVNHLNYVSERNYSNTIFTFFENR